MLTQSEEGVIQLNDMELVTSPQLNSVTAIKNWVVNEAEFCGRTDDDFLLMFLRGCKFDEDKSKRKIHKYYENRRNLSFWWSDRDLNDPNAKPLAELKIFTALKDSNENHPLVAIIQASRFGQNLNNFDDYLKLCSIVMEVIMRRRNSQLNGLIVIVDCQNYPLWFVNRLLWPITTKNVVNSYYLALPVLFNKMLILNAPTIMSRLYSVVRPLLPEKIKQRVFIFGSEWSQLCDHVPLEALPEEYGGQNGILRDHEDEFFEELVAFNGYLLDDNKYGFPFSK